MYKKIIELIKKSNNLVVFTGAGISTSRELLELKPLAPFFNKNVPFGIWFFLLKNAIFLRY
jgi:NAD-dependent SIR2 family protein deacetylase